MAPNMPTVKLAATCSKEKVERADVHVGAKTRNVRTAPSPAYLEYEFKDETDDISVPAACTFAL